MTPGWCILLGEQQRGEVTIMADIITPPGKARVVPCPECNGAAGRGCLECHGHGWHIMRACPVCGVPGWDYINGTDDRDGMTCRISCGYRWKGDDPGWQAQVLPASVA